MFVKILQKVKIETRIGSSEGNLIETHFRQTDKVSLFLLRIKIKDEGIYVNVNK